MVATAAVVKQLVLPPLPTLPPPPPPPTQMAPPTAAATTPQPAAGRARRKSLTIEISDSTGSDEGEQSDSDVGGSSTYYDDTSESEAKQSLLD